MELKPLRKDLKEFIAARNLIKQWSKARYFFENNMRHPSLNTELLEPKWRGIYSFRIDLKYRALFFISDDKAEVFRITKHYRKS